MPSWRCLPNSDTKKLLAPSKRHSISQNLLPRPSKRQVLCYAKQLSANIFADRVSDMRLNFLPSPSCGYYLWTMWSWQNLGSCAMCHKQISYETLRILMANIDRWKRILNNIERDTPKISEIVLKYNVFLYTHVSNVVCSLWRGVLPVLTSFSSAVLLTMHAMKYWIVFGDPPDGSWLEPGGKAPLLCCQ